MAILKRVKNGTGDGAGRAKYALKKAIMVWTDIPSSLSLLPVESLLKKKRELANEFNRHLKKHQGSYVTQHFVLSFGHHLSENEIVEVLEHLKERIFYDPTRLHLIAVHQEKHGTAFHIIESGNQEGKLRHISRKEFFDLNREVKKVMQPFMNEREKEVALNFHLGIATQDWMTGIECHKPTKSFKVKIRKKLEQALPLIEKGEIKKAKKFLLRNGIQIKEFKEGELSPINRKPLKHKRLYAIVDWEGKKVAVQIEKKMKATYMKYLKAVKGVENGLERIGRKAEENTEGIEKLRNEVKALEREGIKIEKANRELRARIRELARGSEELEGEISGLEEGIQRDFREIENIEAGNRETSELEQAIRNASSIIAKDRELEARDFERVRKELGHLYEQVREEFGITREEFERKDNRDRNEPENEDSRFRTYTEESGKSREEDRNFKGRVGGKAIGRSGGRGKEGEIHSSSDSCRSSGRDGRSLYRLGEEDRILEGNGKQSRRCEERAPRGNSRENKAYLDRSCNTGNSPSPKSVSKVGKSEKEEEVRTWSLNGEEVTEEEIKGNPAFYVDCEIEEVRKLAWNYLIEQTDEEVEFLEAEGYFRDIEELEMFDEFREEIIEEQGREEEDRKRDNGMGLGL